MGKGFNNYMTKKFFHPSSKENIKRVWMAEQKTMHEKKKQEDLLAQYQKEQDVLSNRALLGDEKAKLGLSFLYDAPPGLKKKEKEDDEPEFKFEWQRKFNAPRESYAKDNDEIRDQPFGIEVRNVRCIKCRQWGHVNTDKICPLFGKNLTAEPTLPSTSSAGMLENQKDEESFLKKSYMARMIEAGGDSSILDDADDRDPEVQFLKSLTHKQRMKLIRKFSKVKDGETEKKKKKKKKDKKNKKKKSHSKKREKTERVRDSPPSKKRKLEETEESEEEEDNRAQKSRKHRKGERIKTEPSSSSHRRQSRQPSSSPEPRGQETQNRPHRSPVGIGAIRKTHQYSKRGASTRDDSPDRSLPSDRARHRDGRGSRDRFCQDSSDRHRRDRGERSSADKHRDRERSSDRPQSTFDREDRYEKSKYRRGSPPLHQMDSHSYRREVGSIKRERDEVSRAANTNGREIRPRRSWSSSSDERLKTRGKHEGRRQTDSVRKFRDGRDGAGDDRRGRNSPERRKRREERKTRSSSSSSDEPLAGAVGGRGQKARRRNSSSSGSSDSAASDQPASVPRRPGPRAQVPGKKQRKDSSSDLSTSSSDQNSSESEG